MTPEIFKLRFPEFLCEDDDRIQMFIDDSVIILNETFWGDKYELGLAYLSAHFLIAGTKTANGDKSVSGTVSGKSVDGVSISYAVQTPNNIQESFFSSTSYGQRYLVLKKSLSIGAAIV